MLVGDHAGASALFPLAEQAPNVVKWLLERERGRYAFRKADFVGATAALGKALEGCGGDPETYLLVTDVGIEGKQPKLLARVKELAAKRLKDLPEQLVIDGKLAFADGNGKVAAEHYAAAAKAFEATKASPRRMAQASFGRAVTAYFQKNDPVARNAFDLTIEHDPSIYAAYLFLSDMVRDRDPKRALDLAGRAVKYNPDLVDGWVMVGTIASQLKDKKLRAEAITRIGALAPSSEALRALQAMP
jgi:tetratricopeptide (TPR) repeat protein